jgi:hypothetical protein
MLLFLVISIPFVQRVVGDDGDVDKDRRSREDGDDGLNPVGQDRDKGMALTCILAIVEEMVNAQLEGHVRQQLRENRVGDYAFDLVQR